MFALLKLIPLKDWIYSGIIATLLILFGVYTIHERHVGQQTIETKDKALADAQIVKNKETEDDISKGIQTAIDKWKQDHPISAPASVPNIVCHNAPASSTVSKGGSSTNPSNGAGAAVPISSEQADAGFNPAQQVSYTGTQADTEIVRLKAKVTLLQDTIQAYQDGGLVQGK